jgi:serine/threonine-protein kinase
MADPEPSSTIRIPADVSGRPELIGRVLSERYRVDALIATGNFGAVYRGVHLHMRKQIAIKVLHPEIENFPELVHRFEREAVAGAHISHPNVAVASDLGKFDEDSFFLVQEFVDGETLRATLERERLGAGRAARIARQIAAALGAAHKKGILHRDLKPKNVMLVNGSEDFVKLIDFGFASVPSEMPSTADLEPPDWRKSDAGEVFGTVAYLAPEASGGMLLVTERSELYALGVILYEMVAGRHPFDPELPPAELFAHHRLTTPPTFGELDPPCDAPEALEAVVRRLLAKDPAERFQDADELIAALDQAMGDDPDYRALTGPESLKPHPSREPRNRDLTPRARQPWSRRRQTILLAASGLIAAAALAAWMRAEPTAAPPMVDAAVSSPPSALAAASVAAPSISSEEALLDKKKRDLVALTPVADIETATAAVLELIDKNPQALADTSVENAVVTLLARLPSASDSADRVFYALTYKAGPAGLDALYRVFDRYPSSFAARHAESALTAVSDRASPALQVTWALRRTPCWEMPRLFERAGSVGDERTLVLLVPMNDPSCKARRGQCCFRDHDKLEKAIAQLAQR